MTPRAPFSPAASPAVPPLPAHDALLHACLASMQAPAPRTRQPRPSPYPCRYRGGEARFVSDLVSTLGIIHEYVMREATSAKLRVQVLFNPRCVDVVWRDVV
jgi:hypothetical protein